jgi:hypothetical protein
MKNTVDINRYDFTKMIKDFEANERSQNIKQRLKKKYQEENKKYQLNIEHMKELREQNYIQRNTDLRNRLKKKESLLITSLENIKSNKNKEKKRLIEINLTKKNNARLNVEKFLKEQEKNRIVFQNETNQKCKFIYIIYN